LNDLINAAFQLTIIARILIRRFYPLKQINSKSQIEAKRDGKAGAFSIIAYLMLIRPENVFITALSVYVAGLISSIHGLQFGADLSKAALSAALIAAGGNIFNDYCDRDLDRIQKPQFLIASWAVFLLSSQIGRRSPLGGGFGFSVPFGA